MKSRSKSTVSWEGDIYAKGDQLNNWPYSEVVSAVLRATKGKSRNDMRFLEIGCGAGNNLWFACAAGFKVSGIDISLTAIKYATARLSGLGFPEVDLRCGGLDLLPWETERFDIVLDRGALTHTCYEYIRAALVEVRRVLKPGGSFFSFTLFGTNHTDRQFGQEISYNTYDRFTDGYFRRVGLTSFFEEKDIRQLFRDFREVKVFRHRTEALDDRDLDESYSVSCIK